MNSKIKTDRDAFQYVKHNLLNQDDKSIGVDENMKFFGWKESTLEQIKSQATSLVKEKEYPDEYDIFLDLLIDTKCDARCAIGFLFDEKFEENLRDLSDEPLNEYHITLVKESNPEWYFTNNSLKLLYKLMDIHDNVSVNGWQQQLLMVENHFNKRGEYIGTAGDWYESQ